MAISDNQRDDNADTRQKNQPDSVISNGVWYNTKKRPDFSGHFRWVKLFAKESSRLPGLP